MSFSSTKSGLLSSRSAVKSESCGNQDHIVGNLLKVLVCSGASDWLEQLAEVLRRWLLSSSAGSTCSAVRSTCRKEPAAPEGGVGGKTGKGQEPPRARLDAC